VPEAPDRQAIAQVITNIPTITKPIVLMLMFSSHFQYEPESPSSEPTSPPSSMVPMTSATATDRPMIAGL
jgi:hypothetical protein